MNLEELKRNPLPIFDGRASLFNYFIRKRGFLRYLEIGVGSGSTFNRVECSVKTGVDPNGKAANVSLSSDDFFSIDFEPGHTYDLVFVDGLHEWKQAARDVRNALGILSADGLIFMHDTNPGDELTARVPRDPAGKGWHGDVWKAILYLRTFPDVDVLTCAWQCLSVVVPRENSNFFLPLISESEIDALEYEHLAERRRDFLNLVDTPLELVDFIERDE